MDTIVDWKAKDGPGRVISTDCHGHKDKTHGMVPSLKLQALKIVEQANMHSYIFNHIMVGQKGTANLTGGQVRILC